MTSYLVTGGTGTFGRAFIPHVLKAGASRVVCLGRHEAEMAQFERDFSHPNLRCYLGDVRDLGRLTMAMHGIDYVVHAAALKRIEQCERDPIEAVKTNVEGSEKVIAACLATGVKKVVLLSTDKAVFPINLYGATKACAERMFLAANNMAGGRCCFGFVRYGNIWGSRGSVVPQWRAAIEWAKINHQKIAIQVTDPEATRYFLRIEEAVALVLDLFERMPRTKVLLPTELIAYRLGDLADCVTKKQQITGLPAFEKIHETLDGISHSGQARRMTMRELQDAISDSHF